MTQKKNPHSLKGTHSPLIAGHCYHYYCRCYCCCDFYCGYYNTIRISTVTTAVLLLLLLLSIVIVVAVVNTVFCAWRLGNDTKCKFHLTSAAIRCRPQHPASDQGHWRADQKRSFKPVLCVCVWQGVGTIGLAAAATGLAW